MIRIRLVRTKSTNVRIQPAEPRALGAGLVLWAGAVSLAAADGVFARLPVAVDLALAVFATFFAAATYAWDAGVRAKVDAASGIFLALLAFAGDALAVRFAILGAHALAYDANALIAFFALPLALAAHLPVAAGIARTLAYVSGCEVTWREPGRDLSSW